MLVRFTLKFDFGSPSSLTVLMRFSDNSEVAYFFAPSCTT